MVPVPQRRRRVRLEAPVYGQSGTVGLLTACTASRRPVFADPANAELVTSEIQQSHGGDWRILAFCVMPDHVHLCALVLGESLVELMRRIKGRTARSLRGQVSGTLWQRSFHDHLLRRNQDLAGALRYLLENPVRAGLVSAWTAYPWCGSPQWPDLDAAFFAVNPADVMWSRVEIIAEGTGRA